MLIQHRVLTYHSPLQPKAYFGNGDEREPRYGGLVPDRAKRRPMGDVEPTDPVEPAETDEQAAFNAALEKGIPEDEGKG